ncbi:helicase-related protein [Mesorhizobium sp. MSK_1335]|uniref:Helicase-related protein n=1 Tax=Mesorhizobium montanum TaxID=3072323 RepID=A0ABU4ZNU9_9HYPH|nr:helicase-related protein [Mesorhizobium sp. MSK_1335]MDX8527000.1 helicase-related protein [Mesorhizobium sp. MSK_1335]
MDQEAVRSGLLETTRALLLGPLNTAEIINSAPADTYLTGILWPEGEGLAAIEDDESDGAFILADGEEDAGVPGYRAFKPCSIGLTFAADASATLRIGLGKTARYRAVEIPPADQGGRPRRAWSRMELGYEFSVAPGAAGAWNVSEFENSDGAAVNDCELRMHIRRRLDGDQQVLTVTMINASRQADDRHRDELCLFQTEIVVQSVAGARSILPRQIPMLVSADDDARSAALLYRNVLEFAVGHGVSADWSGVESRRALSARTAWMARSNIKGMSAEGHSTLDTFRRAYPRAFDAAWLAREECRAEITDALNEFVSVYDRWIDRSLQARLSEFEGSLRQAAERNFALCHSAARRMRLGAQLLSSDDQAWAAFVLANAAMDRQANYPVKRERRGALRWRPFQLAYFLLVLPGLVDSDNDDAERDCMDLLWFPTGGGKTEAYLALTAFEIMLRRLKDSGRRDTGGVDVLMRYTLRLLTVQQFQRAASLICACEALRRERGDLGAAHISLGLYVGDEATPNRGEKARAALEEERDGLAPRSTPRQLLECPVCGSSLTVSCYSMARDGTCVEIRCANPSCETAGHTIPVITVDEFIYRTPPSLLIGTIDKFAQLPRRKDIRSLFALDGGLPPGLIIQDELHLISGPLGSMAGLYETIVDLLCTRGSVRPKVIGSTATIGQAERQVHALFDRTVLQFPPAGFDAGDSFFAVTDDQGPDRIYCGVSSAGRSPKFALQALAAALLQAAEAQRTGGAPALALDPYWTCVLYFNSLRELGGAYVLMQDDVPRQMTFISGRLGTGPARLLEHEPVELSSRVPSRELPEKLARLAVDAWQVVEDPFAPSPEDTVLASNMISVGVDIPRLGLMLMNGQPKSTAEYIQASSRVGRGLPGLVLTLYNFGRPRDVSHFEHFNAYHAALYRNVEATSVTPWAPRARDKALHAVLAAAVRHLVADMDDDDDALDFDVSNNEVQRLIEAILQRANSSSAGIEFADTASELRALVREWAQRSSDARAGGRKLLYWERKAPFGAILPHLMNSAEDGARHTGLAWPTPNSLREVEPSTAFSLKTFGGR